MFYINIDDESEKKFDLAKFLEFDGIFDPFNSYMMYQIPLLPKASDYLVTTEEGRPDLISWRIYADTQFWWVIMLYNGLTLPTQLKNNMMIKYPHKAALEQLYLNASINNKVIE